MPTLAIYHTKGGVGKTATAVNLAYLAAQSGAHTLLCDLDPQSSATFYYRVKPKLTSKAISQNEYPSCSPSPLAGEGWDGGGQARSVYPCPAPPFHPHPRPPPLRGRESRR